MVRGAGWVTVGMNAGMNAGSAVVGDRAEEGDDTGGGDRRAVVGADWVTVGMNTGLVVVGD